ncbi:Fe-S cluster assembly scaffold protein NifU [candidate division KSB1 bacterium]|nr:Fe-S cluster assembly scaffold protein NifU [candidate division KSB1 bacterium]MBL7092365.1 Fe-S cluster assembly scaffold protein NifU [candidate division KSB1 bacterium]
MNHQYNEKVVDHFMNPRNVGEIEDADGIGDVGSPSCGDVMKLFIKVENDIIIDVKYKTFGCAAAIASGSMATELIKGKTINEALKITNDRVTEQLGGLPKAKRHCSVLAEQALQNALNDYYKRKGIPSPIKLMSEQDLVED